jgi:hypothetical protein
MSHEPKLPSFDQFSRWLVSRLDRPGLQPEHYEGLKQAAREARDEFVRSQGLAADASGAQGPVEVLQLLAAADKSASALPPEVTTSRGFRIALAYEDTGGDEPASIGVLVHCPAELVSALEGQSVYLWYGTERFELGQFDGEGKAIGALPAHIEITSADFAEGRVKLEEPKLSGD